LQYLLQNLQSRRDLEIWGFGLAELQFAAAHSQAAASPHHGYRAREGKGKELKKSEMQRANAVLRKDIVGKNT
jgi:hypothetical protein